MTKAINLGIWMDHSSAHLMEFSPDLMESTTIDSQFTHQERTHSVSKGEKLMHNKEQHLQSDYYQKLGEVIRNYEAVLLFGPTDAKTELFNILKADHRFDNIQMEVQTTDKMTEHQEHAFVKAHFSKKIKFN